MRMGIGIGWPNASAGNQPEMAYFLVESICGGDLPPKTSTQLVDISIYQPGDFVDFEFQTQTGRLILGEIVYEVGETVFNISGPVYTSCPA